MNADIASDILALTTARNNIRTKLEEKGVDASGHGFADFASDIESIPSGEMPMITWPKNVNSWKTAQPILRDTLGVKGRKKIILADDIVPSVYETMIMWVDEDDQGVAEMHNRGWGTFGLNNDNQTRFYGGHHYWVLPCDTVPAKPTT